MTKGIHDRVKFGAFEVDLRTRELRKNGLKLKLGGQPFEILATLLENQGELVTRQQLRTKIWSADTFVDFNHGLNAAVNKLRECLNDSAEEPRYIETLPRRGYRFISKTEKIADELPCTPQSAAVPVSQPSFIANRWGPMPPAKPWVRTYAWGFLAGVFLLAVFSVWWLRGPAAQELRLKLERETISNGSAEVIRAPSIWRLDLTRPDDADARTIVTAARDRNEGPQSSPDGKKLAFMSDRSGSLEIWTSNQDGSSLAKLTNMGSCGSPRWSPDSRWIAFDSTSTGPPAVYIVPAGGGEATALVEDQSQNMVPSWSNDGRWIYFASSRTGVDQVWKVAADHGPPVQVTRNGGFAPVESSDGRTIYYAKTRLENPEIWQVPAQGGAETLVSPLLRPGIWANWALTRKGILFLSNQGGESRLLEFFDFATRTVQPILPLDRPSFWFSASSDGKSAWYTQGEQGVRNATLR
jgi:Tol biopolymer transport system component/DNA-binding winged helix-turn-helix (wHTH) protein